jgi:hypothetical protein
VAIVAEADADTARTGTGMCGKKGFEWFEWFERFDGLMV